jgi:hypothetical protein
MIPWSSSMIRLALVVFSLSAPVALAEEGVALPPGFDGLYAPEGMPCAGSGRIQVEKGTFIHMDGAMTVTDLIEFPGEPNKVEVTMLGSGGGGEWTESAVITLSVTDRDTALVLDYADGNRSIWLRCEDLPQG